MSGIRPRRSSRPWGRRLRSPGAQTRGAAPGAAHRGLARTATCRSSRATPTSRIVGELGAQPPGDLLRRPQPLQIRDHPRDTAPGVAASLVGFGRRARSPRTPMRAPSADSRRRPPLACTSRRDRRRSPAPTRRPIAANDSPRSSPTRISTRSSNDNRPPPAPTLSARITPPNGRNTAVIEPTDTSSSSTICR